MGHATTTDISKFINKQLRAGPVTIRSLVDAMVEKEMVIVAGEGPYTGAVMLGEATSQILDLLHIDGCVEPHPTTNQQKYILKQRQRGEDVSWDSGDDGRGGEYAVFDSIIWIPLKSRFSVIHQISN